MFTLRDNFTERNTENQPFSVENERVSKYTHNFGYVDERGYLISCNGGKHFFKMPCITEGTLSFDISYNPPKSVRENRGTAWFLYFGYDRTTRVGYRVKLSHISVPNRLEMSLEKDLGESVQALEKVSFENKDFMPLQKYPVSMEVEKNAVTVSFLGETKTFAVGAPSGVFGITKDDSVFEIILNSLVIHSPESPKKETVLEKSFVVPTYDGGEAPYTLALSISKYENGVHEVSCTMTGGITDAPAPPGSVWLKGTDCLEDPYIRFIGDCDKEKLMLKNGDLIFLRAAESVYTEEYMGIVGANRVPYTKTFYLTNFADIKYFVFGYKTAKFDLNFPRESEFVFDLEGALAYHGAPLSKDIRVLVSSPKDKAYVQKVRNKNPKEAEKALAHVMGNHYFDKAETPQFEITIGTTLDTRFLSLKVYLLDAYFKKIKELPQANIKEGTDIFGLASITLSVKTEPLAQNVYHILVECAYGDKTVESYTSAFEVLDSSLSISPQKSAGYPAFHVGEGFLNAPNPWTLHADDSFCHYVDSILFHPNASEEKEAWKLTELYKRNFLVWYNSRTSPLQSLDAFPGTIAHADIINLYPPKRDDMNFGRLDLFYKSLYGYHKGKKAFYNEFVRANPDLGLSEAGEDEPFDGSLVEGLEKNFDAWTRFIGEQNYKALRAQWEEVTAINPDAKRFVYGPFPAYATNCVGGEAIKFWYGNTPANMADIYNGFFLFEDYPYWCGYPTSYGAWVLMTAKLLTNHPNTIAPELYGSAGGGCPDGYVIYGMPPLCKFTATAHQTVTQMYEYAYNAVYYKDNAFHYWQDDSFKLLNAHNRDPKGYFRTILSGWGTYRENKPKKPWRTTGYLFKTTPSDDIINLEKRLAYNRATAGMHYIFDTSHKMGIPAGFVTETTDGLSADALGLLVLPSAKTLSKDEIAQIRALYEAGVSLIATSDVDGLEDIFGVKYAPEKKAVNTLYYGTKHEDVAPAESEFRYIADDAEVLVSTDADAAVVFKKNRAVLINCCLGEVGAETFDRLPATLGRTNVSVLLKEVFSSLLEKIAKPIAMAEENCGINVFESVNGDTCLLLSERSPQQIEAARDITVFLPHVDKTDIACISDETLEIQKLTKDGKLHGFIVHVEPRQSLLFTLK